MTWIYSKSLHQKEGMKMNVKRLFLTLCLVFSCFLPIQAEQIPNNWQAYYMTNKGNTYYINWDSLTYDKHSNTAQIQIIVCNAKHEKLDETLFSFDFSDKTYTILYNKDYENPSISRGNYWKNIKEPIPPVDTIEGLVNIVTDDLQLPRVYAGGEDRWLRLSSRSLYIAQDCLAYDAAANTCVVWLQRIQPQLGLVIGGYTCDFNHNTMFSYIYIKKPGDNPPTPVIQYQTGLTHEEQLQVLKTAKELCQKQGLMPKPPTT